MAFFRQTWTLCEKTLTIVFTRHLLGTLIRAFFAPIIFLFVISYAKNFFVPPSNFGVGSPTAIRSLSDAVALSAGGRETVVFINNGFRGGQIEQVINQLAAPIRAGGMTVQINESSNVLPTTCKSSVRGVSTCFAAVDFHSSPNEGSGGVWNYTLRADGSLGGKIFVDSTTNDAEIYVLPLQHAIDRIIAGFNSSGSTFPETVQQYPYTSKNNKERDENITRLYMGTLINILGVAYLIGIIGICYQLTGEMAKERELGMSQLIEAMMPNRRRWTPQAARLLSTHIAFDILYLPSWIIMGLIVAYLNYTHSDKGITVGYFILGGLALSSWSIAFASLFSRAQLSGITVVIVSIVLGIIIQVIPPLSTGAAYILTLLFPPMQFVYFIIYMAYWQQHNLPAQLSQAAPDAPWRVPGYVFFVFAAIQIVVFPIVGAMIERTLYGTASSARKLRYDGEEDSDAVRMQGITKLYPPKRIHRWFATIFRKPQRPTVRAVDDVDMVVGRGQILVLLGANGSGKSTSLDMLAGLQVPTAGTIEMDAHGGIGLCPQKNVLWDELTVYEHVRIFNRLKSESRLDTKEEMKQLVADCDLDQKLNARSETLSGGQKRKAQLAMMLTGGSAICMMDEVSSGLDPLSRRKIWDIVLAQRGKRSMILTTHFLDEADLLSDDITILSQGKRVAHGSAVHLKTALGGGYRVHVYHENSKPIPAELESVPKNVMHDQTVYNLQDSEAAARFIFDLEKAGVRDYRVNGPSIEDVFLKLAAEVKDELKEEFEEADSQRPASSEHQDEKGLKLAKGKRLSFTSQTWVLFRKRLMILRRNPWPYAAALLIPIAAAGLVTLFFKTLAPLSCAAADQISVSTSTTLATFAQEKVEIPVGPPDSSSLVGQVYGNISNLLVPVSTENDFNSFISQRYANVTPGGYYRADTPVFAWRGDYDVVYAVATQNLLDLNLTGQPISTSFQPFDVPSLPDAGQSLQAILYFGLAMCVYPGFFALYTTAERLRKVRALHYSNGIQAGPLWAAYSLFDFIIVVLVAAIAVIAFTGTSSIFYAPGYLFLVFVLYGLSATLMAYCWSLVTSSQLAAFAFAAGGQCCMFLIYFVAYLCIITYIPAAEIDRDVNIATFTMGIVFPGANLLRALFITFNEFSVLCRGNSIASYPGEWSVYGSCITYLILQSVVLFAILVAADSGWKPTIFPRRKKHRTQDAEEPEDVDDEVRLETERVESSQDELRVMHTSKAFGSNVAVSDISFGVSKGEVFALLGPNGAGKSTTIGMIRGDTRPTGREGDVLIQDTSILRHRAAARTHLGVCPQFDAMDSLTAAEHLRFYARARGVPDVDHNVEQVLHAVGLAPFKHRMAAKLSGGNKRKLSLGIALIGDPTVVLLDEPSSGMDAASKRVMWRTLSAISSGRSLVLTTHSMEEADALAHRAGIMAKRMLAIGTSDQLRKKHGDAYHIHLVHKNAPHTSEADMNSIRDFIRETFPSAITEDRSFHGQLRFAVPNDRTAFRQGQSEVYQESISSKSEMDGKGSPELKSTEKTATAMTTTNSTLRQRSSSTDDHSSSISALFSALETHKSQLGLEYYSVSQATLDQVFLSIVTKHNILEENYMRDHDPRKQKGYWWRRFQSLLGSLSFF